MTIYWNETGPLIKYDGDLLTIGNLNPELKTKWHMSRWEMIQTGLRFILAARLSR